jgi:hypothetical protein
MLWTGRYMHMVGGLQINHDVVIVHNRSSMNKSADAIHYRYSSLLPHKPLHKHGPEKVLRHVNIRCDLQKLQ